MFLPFPTVPPDICCIFSFLLIFTMLDDSLWQ